MSDTTSNLNAGEPLAESTRDEHETRMTYGEGRMPWFIAAVWITALVSLAAYAFHYFVPDLRQWGGS